MKAHLLSLYVTFVRISTLGYCLYGRGQDCIFPCHCADTSECGDPCTRGCQTTSGNLSTTWTGSTCQIGNIAQGKSTNQTGDWGGYLVASKAVDGVFTTIDDCSHTDTPGVNGQWWVDLGGIYKIYNITVYGRNDLPWGYQLSYLSVSVIPDGGYTGVECGRFDQESSAGVVIRISCPTPLIGRYVHISRYKGRDVHWLVMCDVIIIGHKYIDCSSITCPTPCSDVIGCGACDGTYPPYCNIACESGSYGTNCAQRCGNCANGVACDVMSGACQGCATGYHGDKCDKTCGRCLNKTCAQNSAECPVCELWWADSKCNTEIGLPRKSNEAVIETTSGNNYIAVKWDPLTSISARLANFYQYTVKYREKQTVLYTDGPVVKHATGIPLVAVVKGLRHNTDFDVSIVPQRVMRGVSEENPDNTQYDRVSVKTKCNVPDLKPLHMNLTTPEKEGNNLSEIRVTFKSLWTLDHGCVTIKRAFLDYKTSAETIYHKEELDVIDDTFLIKSDVSGRYEVRLTVINNQDLSSTVSEFITLGEVDKTLNQLVTTVPNSPQIQSGDSGIAYYYVMIVLGVLLAVALVIIIVVVAIYCRNRSVPRETTIKGGFEPGIKGTENKNYEGITLATVERKREDQTTYDALQDQRDVTYEEL